MKKITAISLLVFTLTSIVSCNEVDIRKANTEMELLKKELDTYKNHPAIKLSQAKKYIEQDSLIKAKKLYESIIKNNSETQESKEAREGLDSLLKRIEEKQKKENAKELLGWKAIKPKSNIKYEDLTLNFQSITKTKRWVSNSYDESYHYQDAERGSKFVVAKVSISSSSKNPLLPPILVYRMQLGELVKYGEMQYEFRRWKDYGAYLGNYSDYGNDFAHSKTIPFNCGVEIEEAKKEPLYVVVKREGCFFRTRNAYGNPEIRYERGEGNIKNTLTLDDFDKDYSLVKIIK